MAFAQNIKLPLTNERISFSTAKQAFEKEKKNETFSTPHLTHHVLSSKDPENLDQYTQNIPLHTDAGIFISI